MFDLPALAAKPELTGLARVLAEPGVTDLVCNGRESAQVLRAGSWVAVGPIFATEEDVETAARALVAAGGRRIDLASPFATVNLGDRIRVHAVLRSAVSTRTLLSIRVFGERSFGLAQLVQLGVLDDVTHSRLIALMRGGASLVISGASGAGKTTLLRALLQEIEHQRVIAIEDVAELRLQSPNFISLLTRFANVEGRGEIDSDALLAEALRMRADRIVVGEVRSIELITLLQAANSGHAIATTLHANSASQVIQRLVSIGIAHGLSSDAVVAMSQGAIDAFVHIAAFGDQRRITLRENK